MGNLMLGFVCLMLACAMASAQEVTLFIDGVEVEVPDNKRLVMVPAHWTDEEIYRESHRAESVLNLMAVPDGMVVCNDELVISPGSCTQ